MAGSLNERDEVVLPLTLLLLVPGLDEVAADGGLEVQIEALLEYPHRILGGDVQALPLDDEERLLERVGLEEVLLSEDDDRIEHSEEHLDAFVEEQDEDAQDKLPQILATGNGRKP